MLSSGEHILIVEDNSDISDLIALQALQPLGYQTSIVRDAATAIQHAVKVQPDLIIADIDLPSLSGKDLLTALPAQGVTAPLVVVASKGDEQSVIQAFRLGATDAIFWPARDAEVVRVVERALGHARQRRASSELGRQLDATNLELERKLREMTTILGIGRAVISTNHQRQLFDRILEGALQVAEADASWLMLRDDQSKSYVLKAYRNLPEPWARRLNQPLEDGISDLVVLSGESLSMHGSSLDKFKVASLGKSVAAVPLKVQDKVAGLLIVVRKMDLEIDTSAQTLLAAIADFASISLLVDRLFRALEEIVEAGRLNEKSRTAMFESLKEAVHEEMSVSILRVEAMLSGETGTLTDDQSQALKTIRSSLRRLSSSAVENVSVGAMKVS